jgi:hypothetical protein
MTGLRFVVCVAAAAIVGGFLMVRAEATPLTGVVDSLAVLKTYSQLQQTGCIFGTSRCPAGTKWVCTKSPATAGVTKKCVCRAC